jgi:hypothetical protein
MAVLGIVRTGWAGTSGGPGLTQLAVRNGDSSFWSIANANTATAAVRAYWDAIKAYLPNEIVLTVSPVVDQYDDADGNLVASTTAGSAPATVTGSSTANYSMAAGIKMNLTTGVIRDGRRVRGAVYIVPAGSGAMTGTGTVDPTVRTAIDTAGNAMRSSLTTGGLTLLVWSRFREATATLPERNGAIIDTSGVETSEKTAILRGRRD